MNAETVDLRSEPAGRVQTAAFYAVRDLDVGESVVLLTAADPALLMASLGLQLRDAIAWEIARDPAGWRTVVRPRADTAPAGVIDLLAPRLSARTAADDAHPAGIMLREHDEILVQLRAVESALAETAPEAWEIEPFVAILSGTLAKHEHREESTLFPRWQAALDALAADAAGALFQDVRRALAGA